MGEMIRRYFFLTACVLVAPAAADNTIGQNATKNYWQCIGAVESSVEVGTCLDEELSRQEIRLKKAYSKLVRNTDVESKKLIEKAQTAWLAYRNFDCEAQAIKGGSAAYNSHITCLIRLTANRAEEMDGYGVY